MTTLFTDLSLAPEIQVTLERLGFTTPTEIQARAVPLLLEKNAVDFHGQAQTGTGKTLAFGLPLLHRIDRARRAPQALVVAPTRELAVQIADSLRPFVKDLGLWLEPIYGGVSIEDQIRTLSRGAHIIVGTPGRLNDHLRRGTLSLSQVKTLVLDEADIMLDMGFRDDIEELLSEMPSNREIWLFSATVKDGIEDIRKRHMKNTVSVRVSSQQTVTSNTKQYYCLVQSRLRIDAVSRFIECATDFYGFIFCQTKLLASEIAEELLKRGYTVGALHGDMSQAQRNVMMRKFRNREITIMVATDVAARGIDVQNLTHVINFSVPEDIESYVHRIGRTGRAGREGVAITLVGKQDVYQLRSIEKKFNLRIEQLAVPTRDEIIKNRIEQAKAFVTESLEKKESSFAGIETLIDGLDADQCRKVLSGLLYERFVREIATQEEIPFTTSFQQTERRSSAPNRSSGARRGASLGQEISLSVGTDDGLTRDDIMGVIAKTGLITTQQVFKVRIIKRRTFLEVAPHAAEPLVSALRNASLAGRKLRPSMVHDSER